MTPFQRPVLASPWELDLAQNRAFVRRVADGQRVAALTAFEAVLLRLLDGRRTWQSALDVLTASSGEAARGAAVQVAERLGVLFADGIERVMPYDLTTLGSVESPLPSDGLRAAPGPRVLHWWVTSHCPRRCVYCFAEPTLSAKAPDASLPRARLREIFAEARSLGAENLLVAGAEPLLREDLPEVLGDALASGLDPVLTTKHRISSELAHRLAAGGLRHLSFSLDAVDQETNAVLVGAPSYARQVQRSIGHLRAVGIEFSIQSVVTALAPEAFEGVVAFAANEGARVVQVVPYEPVRQPISRWSNSELAPPAPESLPERIAALARRHPGLRVELFQQLGSGARAGYQCDIGMTKLFFLADGRVHRCYKLRNDPRLLGKSLLDVSIAEAWHDPGFREVLSPPRAEYAGSVCFDCGQFESCHADGRCIYQAALDYGRYTAPDRGCRRSRPPLRLPVLASGAPS